jgi:hypothetical protein
MQEINAWLNSGKDFEAGKALYIKYGENSFFKSLLTNQGPTPFNIKKIGAELKALAPAPPATHVQDPPAQIPFDAPPSLISVRKPPVKAQEAIPVQQPADINAGQSEVHTPRTSDYPKYLLLKEQIQTLYRQIERNRTELDLGTDPKLLHLTAKQILSLHAKLQDCWKLVDYFDEHGSFPLVKPTIEEVRAELSPAKEIQMLRQSTCKAKTRLKSPGCRDVEGTKALILKNNQRIIELGGKVKS